MATGETGATEAPEAHDFHGTCGPKPASQGSGAKARGSRRDDRPDCRSRAFRALRPLRARQRRQPCGAECRRQDQRRLPTVPPLFQNGPCQRTACPPLNLKKLCSTSLGVTWFDTSRANTCCWKQAVTTCGHRCAPKTLTPSLVPLFASKGTKDNVNFLGAHPRPRVGPVWSDNKCWFVKCQTNLLRAK